MWEKTQEELQEELNKKSNTEIQRQTETLGRLLKIIGETVGENKEIKVENIGREILNKIRLEKPEWIGELKQDTTKLEKRLDYIASAIIRKEVVKEVGLKRPDWIKELIPKEIKFPEQKEAEKIIPVLKEIIKELKDIEIPDEVSIKGEVEIKEPKWWKLPDIEKPILALATFIKKYFDKTTLSVKGTVKVDNPVNEVTILNPQKEVKITNLKELEKDIKLITAQLQALGNTGSNGGGSGVTEINAESINLNTENLETLLNSLLTELQKKADLDETQPVSLDTSSLATSSKQDDIITAIGNIPETDTSLLATESKQDDMITAVKGISGRYLPTYDTKVIEEADPNNIVITYKLNSVTVATETIAVSGTTTTISLTLP